ncbi:hypothetical protein [Enterococcus sp. BWR-S5]|uniref:hypothetical protein n=1 Tax=Enterococcus sp. BWR-S5 TaxID=2787714 RepID=UPI001923A15F|nr:hypothetical protein [Enterococcus sp. BWR-S5]MBL1226203.1 hypothetical protein [Enterococcus sp. BWR-S5]
MSDNSTLVAYLLTDTFNVKQAKAKMYIEEQPYFKVPALYFHLKEDEHTEHDYQRIKEAVESFKGNIEWHFGKAYPSRLNYEIVPKIMWEMDNRYPDKLFKDAVSSELYKEICELAISDIPALYEHMKKSFEEGS